MIKTQQNTDKVAMSLSFACVIHCFFVPSFVWNNLDIFISSFLILTSGFLSFSIDNEVIHKFIVSIAVPVSLFAFFSGYKNHQKVSFLPLGLIGLTLLILSAVLGESILGESGEKMLTLIASICVLYAHYMNHKLCQELDCSCHEE